MRILAILLILLTIFTFPVCAAELTAPDNQGAAVTLQVVPGTPYECQAPRRICFVPQSRAQTHAP